MYEQPPKKCIMATVTATATVTVTDTVTALGHGHGLGRGHYTSCRCQEYTLPSGPSANKLLCLPLHLRELETKNSKNWFNVRFFCKPIIYFDMISSLAKKTKATVHRNITNSSTPAIIMAGRSEPQKISQKNIRIIQARRRGVRGVRTNPPWDVKHDKKSDLM